MHTTRDVPPTRWYRAGNRSKEYLGKTNCLFDELLQELGLLIRGGVTNPYREHAGVDPVRQVPPDIFDRNFLVSAPRAKYDLL